MMRADTEHPLWVHARQAAGFWRHTLALYNGDMKEGIYFCGQIVGAYNDLPPVQELMDRVMAEAEATINKEYSMLS
ncbi:MAG: hypothetical protein JW901_01510 [Dehalococcoidia bacterium]|nr:hypothetical protein [Dehalococcoidia bacterium]